MAKRPAKPSASAAPSSVDTGPSPTIEPTAPPVTPANVDAETEISPAAQPAHLEAALQAQAAVANAATTAFVPPSESAVQAPEGRDDAGPTGPGRDDGSKSSGTNDASGPMNNQILSTATTTDLLALGLAKP